MGHELENPQVLNLVQAMVGLITPNFRKVTIETPDENAVALHFLLERDVASDKEEIEDIVFEFEALQLRGINVGVQVLVDDRPSRRAGMPGRRVYGRREPETGE